MPIKVADLKTAHAAQLTPLPKLTGVLQGLATLLSGVKPPPSGLKALTDLISQLQGAEGKINACQSDLNPVRDLAGAITLILTNLHDTELLDTIASKATT